jgi:hypothetical protein
MIGKENGIASPRAVNTSVYVVNKIQSTISRSLGWRPTEQKIAFLGIREGFVCF